MRETNESTPTGCRKKGFSKNAIFQTTRATAVVAAKLHFNCPESLNKITSTTQSTTARLTPSITIRGRNGFWGIALVSFITHGGRGNS